MGTAHKKVNVDKEYLEDARQTWSKFLSLGKISIITTAVLLLLLAAVFL